MSIRRGSMGSFDSDSYPDSSLPADLRPAPWLRAWLARRASEPARRGPYLRLLAAASLVVAALLVFAWHVRALAANDWVVDDAYISLRYAQHLARGDGPVWNSGERVEGYSNPLWVLILSPFAADPDVGRVWLPRLGSACGLLALAALVVFEWRTRRALVGLAALLCAFHADFMAWCLGGLETTLFAFLLTAATLVQTRPREALPRWAGCFHGLLAWTRPEGPAYLAIAAADEGAALVGMPADRRRETWRRIAWRFGLPAAMITTLLAFRLYFYGEWLPNTYHAKMHNVVLDHGFDFVARFVSFHAPFLALALAGFLVRLLTAPREALHVGAAVAAGGVYAVLVNGDSLPAFRWLAPLVPLLALLAADALRAAYALARHRLRAFVAFATAATLALPAVVGLVRYSRVSLRLSDDVAEVGRANGRFMAHFFPRDLVLATNTAGSIPYFSGLRAIDMLGLTDAVIARREIPTMGHGLPGHEKGDGAYVLSRQPDLIQFCSSRGNDLGSLPSVRPCYLSDRELLGLPSFRENYSLLLFHTEPCGRGGNWTWLWVRVDRVPDVTVNTALRPLGEREGYPIWGARCGE